MARKQLINPNSISREMFMEAVEQAKQHLGTDYKLILALGIQPRRLYKWRKGVGPTHKNMVEYFQKIQNIL